MTRYTTCVQTGCSYGPQGPTGHTGMPGDRYLTHFTAILNNVPTWGVTVDRYLAYVAGQSVYGISDDSLNSFYGRVLSYDTVYGIINITDINEKSGSFAYGVLKHYTLNIDYLGRTGNTIVGTDTISISYTGISLDISGNNLFFKNFDMTISSPATSISTYSYSTIPINCEYNIIANNTTTGDITWTNTATHRFPNNVDFSMAAGSIWLITLRYLRFNGTPTYFYTATKFST